MKRARTLALVAAIGGLCLAGPLRAQEAPAPPKPGPEHEHLKKAVGVWDATVEMSEAPGKPPSVSKGAETNTMTGGGLWLVTDFNADMGGQPFEGHGISGWDPAKKKYVGTWVDSWSTGLGMSEGSIDPATKKETAWMDAPDMNGKPVKLKMETVWNGDDERVFTMWSPGPDGKPYPGLKITYQRRK